MVIDSKLIHTHLTNKTHMYVHYTLYSNINEKIYSNVQVLC